MGFLSWVGPEAHLHDVLWAVHDVKNCGRSEGEKFFGDFSVYGGWSGPSDAGVVCVFLSYARVCEPFCLLNPIERSRRLTEPDRARSLALLNPSDPSHY